MSLSPSFSSSLGFELTCRIQAGRQDLVVERRNLSHSGLWDVHIASMASEMDALLREIDELIEGDAGSRLLQVWVEHAEGFLAECCEFPPVATLD